VQVHNSPPVHDWWLWDLEFTRTFWDESTCRVYGKHQPVHEPNRTQHKTLRRRCHPACQNSKQSPQCGRLGLPAHGWNITLSWFVIFSFFLTPHFAHFPRPNRRAHFCAIWFIRRQSQVIAFLEGQTAKVSHYPYFHPKTHPKGAWIGIFQPNCHITEIHIGYLQNYDPIPTKFCITIKTTKYSSTVVQTRESQTQDGGQPPSWTNAQQ